MQKNSKRRVTPTTLTQQKNPQTIQRLSDISLTSDASLSALPELITYDIHETKSAEQLLYESAQERVDPEFKWKKFMAEVESHVHSKHYGRHLVKNLDEKKQWAALHYAVFNNNMFISDQLTNKRVGKRYLRCDINILTGNGENVLHVAARSNYLWQNTSTSNNVETIVGLEETPLRIPAIICTLIQRGVDVNHPDDEGRTPLHLAVMENRLAFVKYLLYAKADIYAKTKLNTNVLHFTFIRNGQSQLQLVSMFQYIRTKLNQSTTKWRLPWNKQINLTLMRTLDNKTPLILAIFHPAITSKIIGDLLIDMKYSAEDIFHRSTPEGIIYQTQLLIAVDQVAQQRLENYDHLRPVLELCTANTFNQLFHFPCRYNNLNLLQHLVEQFPKYNETISKSSAQIVKNVNLNRRDYAGYTPLLTAVFYRSIDCVRYLLQNSDPTAQNNRMISSSFVRIDQKNADGENILHICAKHSVSEELFEMIWHATAELRLVGQQDNNGNLPLHVAAANNQKSMCRKFLTVSSWSTDLLHVKNIHGQTAAHVATIAEPCRVGPEKHHIDKHEKEKFSDHEVKKDDNDDEHDCGLPMLEIMWEITSKEGRRSGLFDKDDDRQTCLHLAAAKGHQKIVQFLVKIVGIEVDCLADRRLTPLHLACENGHGEVVAYLIEQRASPTLRSADLYNSLEIAIINQNKHVVEELLSLPNWRELMRNAQPIHNSDGYDTPMRKLIRYMPKTAIYMIDNKLTRTFGGQGKHVFKSVYDYEFYMDTYRVKQWHQRGIQSPDDKVSFGERCRRRGCAAICYTDCCCEPAWNDSINNRLPYTDDPYTLIRNHPLIIASEQAQCPELVQHPYNTFLRDNWYKQNGRLFYIVRALSFLLYAGFLAVWSAIVLLGKHPQYFYAKAGLNLSLDLDTCANVSRTLTDANDPEALKYTAYRNLKYALYAFLILFVVENAILIIALFPRVFRTIDYILEIAAFVLTFVYILDWYDWQDPVIFRCPIQYQLGAMGLLIAWLCLLTYIKRTTWFDMGVFVVMIQLIGFKFIRFIPVLLVIICGFGFTHWMLLQNQSAFQTPLEAVIRTGLLMFDLGYEDHLYTNQIYYQLVYVITILSAIVFCIFVLNLLISVAVGEIPSLTIQGKIWQAQMLYDLLSDYSIVSLQIMRFFNFISCGCLRRYLLKKGLEPIFILEKDLKGTWHQRAWKYVKTNFFDEKIQEDIIPIDTSNDKTT